MAELKPKRHGNYHHNGNPKHGLYPDNVNLFCVAEWLRQLYKEDNA